MCDDIELRIIPGKGYGLVATAAIPEGTELMREKAALSMDKSQCCEEPEQRRKQWNERLQEQFNKLSQNERGAVMKLYDQQQEAANQKSLGGIFGTNAIKRGDADTVLHMFLGLSRLNHSCTPNCYVRLLESAPGNCSIHTLRQVKPDEELTIAYLPCLASTKQRQEDLSRAWGFTCKCATCLACDSQSDARRLKMNRIMISRSGGIRSLEDVLACDELFALFDAERLILPLYMANAAELSLMFLVDKLEYTGDDTLLPEVFKWLRRAEKFVQIAFGNDSDRFHNFQTAFHDIIQVQSY